MSLSCPQGGDMTGAENGKFHFKTETQTYKFQYFNQHFCPELSDIINRLLIVGVMSFVNEVCRNQNGEVGTTIYNYF